MEAAAVIASTARLIPIATSVHASSRFFQDVTAFPSFGKAWSLPKGALCQSHGRKKTGITLASPRS